MTADVTLREVADGDLAIFFTHQLDPAANAMAAFTAKDPADREAFDRHWRRILAEPTVIVRTVMVGGQVAGSVSSYVDGDHPEVTYWLGRSFWGQGIATQALAAFLADVNRTRPILARAARDNLGSLRVLEKCGFVVIGEDRGFANARGAEIEELVLKLG